MCVWVQRAGGGRVGVVEREVVMEEKRERQVCKDEQARPQDNFWAHFKGKILRMWSECLTQLLCDLLFHHPGHSVE